MKQLCVLLRLFAVGFTAVAGTDCWTYTPPPAGKTQGTLSWTDSSGFENVVQGIKIVSGTDKKFYSLEPDGSEVLVGEEAIIADSSANAQNYQRKTVEFRGVTLSTLRIRFNDSIGVKMDAGNVMLICELHPYGTVAGAGKSAAVRTRVIID